MKGLAKDVRGEAEVQRSFSRREEDDALEELEGTSFPGSSTIPHPTRSSCLLDEPTRRI